MDIQTALAYAIEQLNATSDSPQTDAASLLCHILNKPRSYLLTWPEKKLNQQQLENFLTLVKKRQQGEPIAYLVGKKEFWSLELEVSPATLIPRPETELLVELAIEKLPSETASSALDLGTGSGAIALAIAKERTSCKVLAVDSYAGALSIANKNKQLLQINNLELCTSHWFDGITPQYFDLIVSNPPYVAPNDPHLTQGDLRFEPQTALSAQNNGLADLFHIAEDAKKYLKKGGWLIMEHGYDQKDTLIEKLTSLGYTQVEDHSDYNSQPRVICGCWPG